MPPYYDTYHITSSDFALRSPMSGYNGWEFTHNHGHSSLYISYKAGDSSWTSTASMHYMYSSIYILYDLQPESQPEPLSTILSRSTLKIDPGHL